MPTPKQRRIRAKEDTQRNHFDGSYLDQVESETGEGLEPILLGKAPEFIPPTGDPYHNSYVLIPASRRLDRLARQMVENGFRRD